MARKPTAPQPEPVDPTGELGVAQAEQAHAKLVAFLDQAPDDLKPWAREQLASAERDLEAARGRAAAAEQAEEAREASRELNLLGLGDDDLVAPAPTLRGARQADPGRSSGRPWFLHPLLLLALTAAIVYSVYALGDRNGDGMPDDHPSASPAAAAEQSPVDPALLAGLEQKVKENPKDVDAWRGLGELYNTSGAYDKAADAQRHIIAVVPTDVNAHLALGVALFSKPDLPGAEKAWQQALELDPKSEQGWYNIGFLYLSQGKKDKALQAWEKLVEINPKSTLAEGVKSHLQSLKSPAPSASTSPGGSASPSATPSR